MLHIYLTLFIIRKGNRVVVSTVMFGSIFAAFGIVDYVHTAKAFFQLRHHYSRKVLVETESSLSTKNKEKTLFLFTK